MGIVRVIGRRLHKTGSAVHKAYRKAQTCNTHKTPIQRKAELRLKTVIETVIIYKYPKCLKVKPT